MRIDHLVVEARGVLASQRPPVFTHIHSVRAGDCAGHGRHRCVNAGVSICDLRELWRRSDDGVVSPQPTAIQSHALVSPTVSSRM